jgi:hypothetical protein
MAGFKDIQIEKYIRKIQDAGYTAIVYTQDESVKKVSFKDQKQTQGNKNQKQQEKKPNINTQNLILWVL